MWTHPASPQRPRSDDVPGGETLAAPGPMPERIDGRTRIGAVAPLRSSPLARISVERSPWRYPSRLATCWNQKTSGPGRKMPAVSTSAKWAIIGHVGRLATGAPASRRLAEGDAVEMIEERAEGEDDAEDERDGEQRLAGEGGADDQELAHEDAERRQPGDRDHAGDQAPAEPRMALRSARGCRRSSACP